MPDKCFAPGHDCPLTLIAIEENAALLMQMIREMKNQIMTSRNPPSPENAARRVRIKTSAENIASATKRLLEEWVD